jgi:formyltetrahydrofolate deformylase
MSRRYVITFGCPDRVGIVASIATFLADLGGMIVEAAYHTDQDTGWFFTRQEIDADTVRVDVDELRTRFGSVAKLLAEDSDWQIMDTARRRRVVMLVSKEGHCLYDILGRVASGELDVDVPAVIGNHPDLAAITEAHGIPFHHVPFPAEDKEAAFETVRQVVDTADPHAIVLARFMQILPAALCAAWAGRALNIHHSFLPSFVGAKPYHQAHRRGVKLIGATCHYVTENLDAGPIIEQDVLRVTHRHSVEELERVGRDLERLVLARAVEWHLDDRVLVHENRTIVF